MSNWKKSIIHMSGWSELPGLQPIYSQTVNPLAGTAFHDSFQGTGLRRLQHQPFHLSNLERDGYKEALNRILPDISHNPIVCDLGCGDGRFTEWLLERGAQRIIAVDSSLGALQSLAAWTHESGSADYVLLVHASAEDVRLPTKSCDIIFAVGVLFYLNDRFEAGLDNAIRATADQGTLALMEPDFEGRALVELLFHGMDHFRDCFDHRQLSDVHDGVFHKFRCFMPGELEAIYSRRNLVVTDRINMSIWPTIFRLLIKRGLLPGHAEQEDLIRRAISFFQKQGQCARNKFHICKKATA